MSRALDRAAHQAVFEEDFQGPELDSSRWIAHHLPHWTNPERSAARFALREGVRPDLTVQSPQPTRRLYTPSAGLVEATLRASRDPSCMPAFWLVGFEESGEQSGEICVAELYGNAIGTERSAVRLGVKAHHDPRLHDDMADVVLDLDATAWHTYSAEWTADQIRLFVDDRLIGSVHQHIDYPLQLMVDLFEFPADRDRDPSGHPRIGEVSAVRGYRRGPR